MTTCESAEAKGHGGAPNPGRPQPTSGDDPWWVSFHVTRTRITLIGFNLSVIAFLFGALIAIHEEQAFTHHLPAMSSLFVAFCLSILSAICLLASQELDQQGLSRPWIFSVGDILLYLAISQSVAGFLRKFLAAVDQAVKVIHQDFGAAEVGGFLTFCLSSVGLVGWLLTVYVAPVVSICKSPVKAGHRWVLGCAYVAALFGVFLVATQAHILVDAVVNEPEPTLSVFLWQFLQPLTW